MLEAIIFALVCMGVGYMWGQKGININIYHEGKSREVQKGEPQYNPDYSEDLPPEIQQYYEKTKGMNMF